MKIRNLDFKHYVFGQSGVQGFFGEPDEYPHHWFYRFIPGFSFLRMVFVAKTVTINARIYPETSNTELRDGYKVKRLLPTSVWWSLGSFIYGYLLNAVGLANPGATEMFEYMKWQVREGVFQLSFMPMASSLDGKIAEAREFCSIMKRTVPTEVINRIGTQINLSCPNTGHGQAQDSTEAIEVLKVFRSEFPDMPLIPKFDLTIELETIAELKPYCDAFMISNTLAFGKKSEWVNWSQLFKGGISPLKKYFNGKFEGGLSGAPLFPLLLDWLTRMEEADPTVKIIAGGGIMEKADIKKLSEFSIVKGIALGSVAILRPWRVKGLIDYGNKIFSQRKNNN